MPAPATESTLDLAPAPILVRDARGMNVALTPGVLDDNARHLYKNGQCLALALALARSRPDTGISVLAYEADDGRTAVQHAWAVAPNGALVDVDGENDRVIVEEMLANGEFYGAGDDEYTEWHDYGPDELDLAAEETCDWIGPQRYDLAATFAPDVWEELETSAQWCEA